MEMATEPQGLNNTSLAHILRVDTLEAEHTNFRNGTEHARRELLGGGRNATARWMAPMVESAAQ